MDHRSRVVHLMGTDREAYKRCQNFYYEDDSFMFKGQFRPKEMNYNANENAYFCILVSVSSGSNTTYPVHMSLDIANEIENRIKVADDLSSRMKLFMLDYLKNHISI